MRPEIPEESVCILLEDLEDATDPLLFICPSARLVSNLVYEVSWGGAEKCPLSSPLTIRFLPMT